MDATAFFTTGVVLLVTGFVMDGANAVFLAAGGILAGIGLTLFVLRFRATSKQRKFDQRFSEMEKLASEGPILAERALGLPHIPERQAAWETFTLWRESVAAELQRHDSVQAGVFQDTYAALEPTWDVFDEAWDGVYAKAIGRASATLLTIVAHLKNRSPEKP